MQLGFQMKKQGCKRTLPSLPYFCFVIIVRYKITHLREERCLVVMATKLSIPLISTHPFKYSKMFYMVDLNQADCGHMWLIVKLWRYLTEFLIVLYHDGQGCKDVMK